MNYVSNLLDAQQLEACICGWVELLGDKYKAVLFLVEKEKKQGSIAFDAKSIGNLFTTVGF